MNDANGSVPRSADLEELHSLVDGLIGRKCWKVAFTYGGELSLHFGRRLAYRNRKMTGKRTGQWRLDTRATAWSAFTPQGAITSRERVHEGEKTLEARLNVLEGRRVTNISVSVPGDVLTIAFGNDYLFRVTPAANSAKSSLAYWRLFMPDHKQVTFGPGRFWESLIRQTGTGSPKEAAHVLQTRAGVKSGKS